MSEVQPVSCVWKWQRLRLEVCHGDAVHNPAEQLDGYLAAMSRACSILQWKAPEQPGWYLFAVRGRWSQGDAGD
ncbi:hypothetical protein [Brevibacillus sp. SAFN-007a]|uniref:hypothetical protein n=1 Tax=Brevibacillus sp. SAFN-007a TaxID=3436862 RepID=UPI003F7E4DED